MREVPLPRDHEGREIPLDALVLYDAKGSEDAVDQCWQHPADSLYLNPPDSWERLLEDLDEGANHSEFTCCFYFRMAECDCSLCRADRYPGCNQPAFKDIASRIRNLRGEVREDS